MSEPRTLVLVGQPNVGKSALFGRLTGRYVTCSNYAGTTVELFRGRTARDGTDWEVIDTPGLVELGARREDEAATRRLLQERGADAVVLVADAKSLLRAVGLLLQVAELHVPVVMALNMSDEQRARGIEPPAAELSRRLGVPVVATVATTGEGIEELWHALPYAAEPVGCGAHDAVRRPRERDLVARQLLRGLLQEPAADTAGAAWGRRVAAWSVHPVWGLVTLAVVLAALYVFVGQLGAVVLVGWLEDDLFGSLLMPRFAALLSAAVPSPFLQDLLVGPYGLVSMALTYSLALILPVVTTFFLAFGVLEDSGYFPRLSVMANRSFTRMGLSGQAVLPMILGLSCDTMATVTTRVLETRKERVLATLLLALGVPCSAQLAVLLAMSAAISPWVTLSVLGIVALQMLIVGRVASMLLPGRTPPFLAELPPLRWPRAGNVIAKTWLRLRWYLTEVVPLFVIGTLVLFGLHRVGALDWLSAALQPVVAGLLGLPAAASDAFVMGFFRRDYGAAGLYQLQRGGGLDTLQVLVSLVVMTLFVPCVANSLVIAKERGVRTAAAILAFVIPYAVLVGTVLNVALRPLMGS